VTVRDDEDDELADPDEDGEYSSEDDESDEPPDEIALRGMIAVHEHELTALELRFLGGDTTVVPSIGDELFQIAKRWSEIRDLHEQAGDAAAEGDAAGEAWAVLQRAIPKLTGTERDDAVELALFMANELGCYHFNRDNTSENARKVWNQGIALRDANPHLPTTITHARLYLNRGAALQAMTSPVAAREAYDRAVSLYAALEDDDQRIPVELGRAWRFIATLATIDEERDRCFTIATAILDTVEDAAGYREAAKTHHDHASMLRKANRFAEAVAPARGAAAAFARIDEYDRTPDDEAVLAGYRGCVAWSLGGAKDFVAAHAEGKAAQDELRRNAAHTTDPFPGSVLRILDRLMPMWAGLESGPVSPPVAPPEPREKVVPPDWAACSFCQRKRSEVKKLISGPQVFICDSCVGLCLDIIEKDWPMDPATKERRGTPKKNANGLRCTFCDVDERRAFVQGPQHRICDDCIDLCVEIIEEEIASQNPR
jgi:hypothetical protein